MSSILIPYFYFIACVIMALHNFLLFALRLFPISICLIFISVFILPSIHPLSVEIFKPFFFIIFLFLRLIVSISYIVVSVLLKCYYAFILFMIFSAFFSGLHHYYIKFLHLKVIFTAFTAIYF